MSFPGQDGFGSAKAGVSSTTTDNGWSKIRVTKLEASATVFRIGKANGEDAQIELLKVSTEAGAETIEVAGQNLPKYAGFEATVNIVAVEGKAASASVGIGIDSKIGIQGNSFNLKVFGTGVKIGEVIGISFMGSEININLTKIDYKEKWNQLQNPDRLTDIMIGGPVSALVWLIM